MRLSKLSEKPSFNFIGSKDKEVVVAGVVVS